MYPFTWKFQNKPVYRYSRFVVANKGKEQTEHTYVIGHDFSSGDERMLRPMEEVTLWTQWVILKSRILCYGYFTIIKKVVNSKIEAFEEIVLFYLFK